MGFLVLGFGVVGVLVLKELWVLTFDVGFIFWGEGTIFIVSEPKTLSSPVRSLFTECSNSPKKAAQLASPSPPGMPSAKPWRTGEALAGAVGDSPKTVLLS